MKPSYQGTQKQIGRPKRWLKTFWTGLISETRLLTDTRIPLETDNQLCLPACVSIFPDHEGIIRYHEARLEGHTDQGEDVKQTEAQGGQVSSCHRTLSEQCACANGIISWHAPDHPCLDSTTKNQEGVAVGAVEAHLSGPGRDSAE